jgi:hypothetical protein
MISAGYRSIMHVSLQIRYACRNKDEMHQYKLQLSWKCLEGSVQVGIQDLMRLT